jgi:hypothetical protein
MMMNFGYAAMLIQLHMLHVKFFLRQLSWYSQMSIMISWILFFLSRQHLCERHCAAHTGSVPALITRFLSSTGWCPDDSVDSEWRMAQ